MVWPEMKLKLSWISNDLMNRNKDNESMLITQNLILTPLNLKIDE